MLSHLKTPTRPTSIRKRWSSSEEDLGGVCRYRRADQEGRVSDSLLVVTPLKGSPAYRAGIQAGDHITTITLTVDRKGKPLEKPEVIATKGLSITDAVRRISGKRGTKVKVTVERAGEDKPLVFEVTATKSRSRRSWATSVRPTIAGTSSSTRRRRSATSA